MSKLCEPGEHEYEGRYDLIYPKDKDGAIDMFAIVGSCQDKIYVCDVCSKCGDIVNRQSSDG